MEDCLFCKIIRRALPSTVVFEDETVFAFEDINPQAPVHTLVIPKAHYERLGDDIPADLLGHLFSVAVLVARIKGVDKTGYRVSTNVGDDGRQTVPHLHIHVMGGARMPAQMGPVD